MTIPRSDWIWYSGKHVPWDQATVHLGAHALHYASAVFEGVRCYDTDDGPAVFRLDRHLQRLFDSAKIFRMPIPYDTATLSEAVTSTIERNGLDACYIRPLVFRGVGPLSIDPRPCPVEVAILVWEWGRYLGAEALEKGVDVRVSSWNRLAANTLPALAKSAANYMNSQLIKLEALSDGYAEGIALDVDGHVSEGSGENLFAVKDGTLITPPLASSVLPGITRDAVITLAREEGIPVREERIPRELLYVADELFFTGTAAEITPIRSVDHIPIGTASRGPITEGIQKAFFGVLRGRDADRHGWLTFVHGVGEAGAVSARRSRKA